jgi:N-acyl-D-amino-acid deacylase
VVFELVITNGTIVDGTGQPRFRADLGIQDGKIVAVAPGHRLTGQQVLDATELVVAPGFVDIHSHADWILPLADHDQILAPLLLQGITTVVAGQCGFSPAPITEDSSLLLDDSTEELRERAFPFCWRTMAEFFDVLGSDGLLLNAAFLVGHSTLRYAVLGQRSGAPGAAEMEAMCQLAGQALRDGALGLSAGLAYAPGIFARNEELLTLLRTVVGEGGIFAVHGRAYSWVSSFYQPVIVGTAHNIRSVRELLELARQSGVRLQLSHQIFVGRHTWRTHRTVLRDVERAAGEGLDVAFDAFPYTCGNTTINVVFPEWFLADFKRNIHDPDSLRRFKRELNLLRWTLGLDYKDITLLWGCAPELTQFEGLDFRTIARRLDLPQFEAYIHTARVSGGKARILLNTYSGDGSSEAPLQATLAHPLCAFMTDTILTRHGKHNPASFGTYPRILGRYCRDLGLFPLEEAVRRMTLFPAERTGLSGLGRIAEGLRADLVLFDPETVADNTTPERPDMPPSGIHAVLIGGQVTARDGQIVSRERHGRVLRRR